MITKVNMSSVQTQTIAQTIVGMTLRVSTLAERIQKPLSSLIKSMSDSPLFSEKEKKEIAGWETVFNKEYVVALDEDEGAENGAMCLCFLLCEIIRPTIVSHGNQLENQIKLLNFEEELKGILQILLPPDANLEAFIESCEKSIPEEEMLCQHLLRIEICFNQKMKELCQIANQANEQFKQQFELIRNRLQTFDQKRKSMTVDMQKQLDIISEKWKLLCGSQDSSNEQIKKTGLQLQAQLESTNQILQQIQNLGK